MHIPNYTEIFEASFDTFKVFHRFTLEETRPMIPSAPKTIWQILNHLLVWQSHQLNQLKSFEVDCKLIEPETWIEEDKCDKQAVLTEAIMAFEGQINQFKEIVFNLSNNDLNLQRSLKILQDVSVHLSFHLGEFILMRRITGNYPMPHQMKEFLD
ncbi:MAG TPA: hypothetical protein VF602_08155 [Pedobacter sp.]